MVDRLGLIQTPDLALLTSYLRSIDENNFEL
jgi:hypothetical protein